MPIALRRCCLRTWPRRSAASESASSQPISCHAPPRGRRRGRRRRSGSSYTSRIAGPLGQMWPREKTSSRSARTSVMRPSSTVITRPHMASQRLHVRNFSSAAMRERVVRNLAAASPANGRLDRRIFRPEAHPHAPRDRKGHDERYPGARAVGARRVTASRNDEEHFACDDDGCLNDPSYGAREEPLALYDTDPMSDGVELVGERVGGAVVTGNHDDRASTSFSLLPHAGFLRRPSGAAQKHP